MTVLRSLLVSFSVLLAGCSLPSLSTPSLTLTNPKTSSSTPTVEAASAAGAARNGTTQGLGGPKCTAYEASLHRVRSLIATLKVNFDNGLADVGSAVLVGEDATSIYLVTALHVVESQGLQRQRAKSIIVNLQSGYAVPASVAPRQPRLEPPFTDLAVLQISRGALPADSFGSLEWDVLPSSADLGELRLAGNPAGRGYTETGFGQSKATEHSLIVDDVAAAPGMSGGAILTRANQLAGLVYSSSGETAEGYPIVPVIHLVQAAGLPVMLRPARPLPPNVFLAGVTGEPDGLRQAVSLELASVLLARGLDPECDRDTSLRLNVQVEGVYPAAVRSAARLKPDLRGPNGQRLPEAEDEESLHHYPLATPFNDVEALRPRIRPMVERLADRIVSSVGGLQR